MSDGFKPAGVAFAAVLAGLAAPVDVAQAADAEMAQRAGEAEALRNAAAQFAPAEPFADAPAQKDLFDL